MFQASHHIVASHREVPAKQRHLAVDINLKRFKDSIPLSSILWVRNDVVISKSNYLTIENATISDSGKYRCLAANTIGTKYSELKLRIN